MHQNNAQVSLIVLIIVFIILVFLTPIQQPIALTQTNDNYDVSVLIIKGLAQDK